MEEISIVASDSLSAVTLEFSNGAPLDVRLDAGRAHVRLESREVSWMRVTVDPETHPTLDTVSISEISIPGLDLREAIRVPDDAFGDDRVASEIERAPVSYLFERLQPVDGEPQEDVLRRVFHTAGRRTYEMEGVISQLSSNGSIDFSNTSACQESGLLIDGRDVGIRLRPTPDPDRVPYSTCAPVELDAGEHLVESAPGVAMDQVTLTTGTPPAPSGPEPEVATLSRDRERVEVRVEAEGPTALVVRAGHDERWRATADGEDLGPARALDAQNGWFIDASGQTDVEASVTAQPWYRLALVITGVSLAGCLGLLLFPRRGRT
jgi:hypothetical protein